MMSHPSVSEELEQIPLISAIPLPLRRMLVPIAHVLEFAPRSVVFREGAPADALYVVISGRIGLDIRLPEHGNVRILTVGPGELLGWSALVGNETMTATAWALQPTQLIAFPGVQLRAACEASHELGYQLMRRLASTVSTRLNATRQQLRDSYGESVVPMFAGVE